MAALSTAYYYSTGTVAVASGGATVTGSGTLWSALVKAGDVIEIAGLQARIKEVAGDTSLTLLLPWPGAAQSGAAYAITFGSPTRFEGAYVAESARTLIAKLGIIDDAVPYYAVIAVGTNGPPASPITGDIYVVGTAPTGVWGGYVGYVARWSGTAWVYTAPQDGMFAYDRTTGYAYIYRSGSAAWAATPGTVVQVMDGLASAVPSLWWIASANLLDGAAPALAANAVTGKCMISGSSTTFETLFPRTGGAKIVVGSDGAATTVAANSPAYDYSTGRRRYLFEGAATNLFFPSAAPSAAFSLSVTAQAYTLSFWGAGSFVLSGTHVATVLGTGANARTTYTFTPSAGTLTITPSGSVTNVQLETGSIATSAIVTTSAAVTRATDVCQWSDAAAAQLSMVGPNALVWRGKICSQISAQSLIRVSGGAFLRAQTVSPVGFAGASSSLTISSGVIPGEVGAAIGWDAAGRIGCVNGSTVYNDSVPLTFGMTSVYLGGDTGMPTGSRHEIDEIVVWSAKGSSAATKSQAHVYGA